MHGKKSKHVYKVIIIVDRVKEYSRMSNSRGIDKKETRKNT